MMTLSLGWVRQWTAAVTSMVPRKFLVALSALLAGMIVLTVFNTVARGITPDNIRRSLQSSTSGPLLETYSLQGQNYSMELKNGTNKISQPIHDIDVAANVGHIVESGNIIASGRNVTPPDARVLLYNRVPKCGSTTVKSMMHRLSWKNGFRHVSARVFDQRKFDEAAQKVFIKKVTTSARMAPFSYDRHMYYFNVTRHGFPPFAWMNFVRNPVSRFISDFYYVRGRHRWAHMKVLRSQPRPSESWFNMSLDTCVAEGIPECLPAQGQDHELQLTYFCGQHPNCRVVGDRGALVRAKRHAEQYYSVVGVLEDMPLSVQVLQAYMPRFFKGVTKLLNGTGEIHRNVKHNKPEVSEATKRVLEDRLKEDMEFYEFLKQRLHLQAKALVN